MLNNRNYFIFKKGAPENGEVLPTYSIGLNLGADLV
jgi:hypothetical protein